MTRPEWACAGLCLHFSWERWQRWHRAPREEGDYTAMPAALTETAAICCCSSGRRSSEREKEESQLQYSALSLPLLSPQHESGTNMKFTCLPYALFLYYLCCRLMNSCISSDNNRTAVTGVNVVTTTNGSGSLDPITPPAQRMKLITMGEVCFSRWNPVLG